MPISGDRYAFTKENVNQAPDVHGVYELYDNSELIYIGRAAGDGVTIRNRLQRHLSGQEGPCTKGATAYRREENTAPISREKELLTAYEKQYGRLPRCNERRA